MVACTNAVCYEVRLHLFGAFCIISINTYVNLPEMRANDYPNADAKTPVH